MYRVPILLSRQPDGAWAALMVQNWDRPPRFTTMHRPGRGSVSGRTFVIDGTTLEEVEQYHLETLEHAIGATNQQYEEIVRRQRARDEEATAAHWSTSGALPLRWTGSMPDSPMGQNRKGAETRWARRSDLLPTQLRAFGGTTATPASSLPRWARRTATALTYDVVTG